jgi:hypothetical protein
MDFFKSIFLTAALVWLWRWTARKLRQKGRGALLSHTAAALLTFTTAVIVTPLFLYRAPTTTSTVNAQTTDNEWQKAYTITNDTYKRTIKRSVEVSLAHRVSEADLVKIAERIKASADHDTERTFIGYRLQEGGSHSYWATTHYNPDLAVVILGWPLKEAEAMNQIDFHALYPGLIGSWLVEDGLGRMALYVYQGQVAMDSVFPNGASNTQKLNVSALGNGTFKLAEVDNERNEYMTVEADGTLRFWGESGNNYKTVTSQQGNLDLTALASLN